MQGGIEMRTDYCESRGVGVISTAPTYVEHRHDYLHTPSLNFQNFTTTPCAARAADIATALARLVAASKQKPPHTAAGTGLSGARHAQSEAAANSLGRCSEDSSAAPAVAVDGREDVREKLDALVDRVKGLRKRTAEATLFLTVYDLRRAQEVLYAWLLFFSCVVRRKRAHISGCRGREAVGEERLQLLGG